MTTRRSHAPLNAYVLHHHDWSESSVILDLFSREMGRLVAVAKGAKRPHSQLRAVLLPLQRIHIQLGRHKGDELPDVHLLRSAEWAGGSAMPGGDALLAGLHLNELLLRALVRHDADAHLFDAYAATLQTLGLAHRAGLGIRLTHQRFGPDLGESNGADNPPEQQIAAALRAFELLLLQRAGLLPQLGCVTQTQQPLHSGRRYRLAGEAGVCHVDDDAPGLMPATLAALQAALDVDDLKALQQACSGALTELKIQLRSLLHYHFGHQPLRTRALMVDVQRLID